MLAQYRRITIFTLAAKSTMLANAGPAASLAVVAQLPVLANASPIAGLAVVALLPMGALFSNSFDSLHCMWRRRWRH